VSTPEFSGPYWRDTPDDPGGSGYRGDAGVYRRGGNGRGGYERESGSGYSGGPGYGGSQPGGTDPYRPAPGSGRAGRRGRGHGRRGSGENSYGLSGYPGSDPYGNRDASYRGGAAYKISGGNGRGTADYRGGTRQFDRSDLVPLPGGGGRGGGGRGGGWGPDDPGGPDDPTGLYRPRQPVRTPRAPRRRQRGDWWRHWTWKKAGLLVGAMALSLVLVLIAAFFYVYSSVKLPIAALSAPLEQSSQVYFSDGKTPVGCFCSINRRNLTSVQLGKDPYLEQAFFAAEDRHFLTEGGISITGTLRALLVDLTGNGYQGGSTITEQYVKTYFQQYAGGNLTYKEKLKEIIDAIKLAKARSKPWILRHYLNAIYLGAGSWGVEAAAQTYFGKNAWQLGPAQSAMLAAMVQEPSGFEPQKPMYSPPGLGYSLLDRWITTLMNMTRDTRPDGQPALTQKQFHALVPDPHNPQADLKNFPKLDKGSAKLANWSGFRGYIMNAVMNELENKYGYSAKTINSGGLQIVTTYNLRKMRALYSAVAEAKHMMREYGQPLPWYAHIGAVLENPKTGAIEASYGGPGWNSKNCAKFYCHYDMAMQSRNQVGSSFKPYVLAAAVQEGMNVQTSVLNGYSPLCVPPETEKMTRSKRGPASSCPSDGVGWLPVSYDPVVEGPVSVVKAAALSSNAAFEDLAHRVGTTPIIHLAKEFGVNIGHAYSRTRYPHADGSGLRDDVGKIGIALGIAPLTVEEQATTFATLADDGAYHQPHVIAKIIQNGNIRKARVATHRVLTTAQTADVDWALSYDTVYGTAYPNAVLSPARPTIAKTGTTNVAQSAFFIGSLPSQYSLAVGMFTNSQNNTPGGQTLDKLPSIGGIGGGYGGAWPATIWKLYMTRLLAMKRLPIAQLNPLQLSGFSKWVQVTKPKPKCGRGGGFGGGNGNGGHGHGHHGFFFTAVIKPCPSPSPSPPITGSPPPSPAPSPSYSPSPFPSPSVSYSPPPTRSAGANTTGTNSAGAPARPPARQQVYATPSLTTSAVLPRPAYVKPGWVPVSTGLI
jgi:membrane peptidoglycan carboxypeptidase